MVENIKYKVADVAKDLKLPLKDVIDTLGEKFSAKKAQTALTEEELNYVFEHYTKAKEVTSFPALLQSPSIPDILSAGIGTKLPFQCVIDLFGYLRSKYFFKPP